MPLVFDDKTDMILINIFIVLFTFIAMEGVAWFVHKYIMHGFLWNLHKSHHSPHQNPLEHNDLFSVFFAIPAVLCFIIGSNNPAFRWLIWIGVGGSLYGFMYFIFHDIIVHRRIKVRFKPANAYLKKIIRAHKVHHKNLHKRNGEAFGFLYSFKDYTAE